MSMTSPTKYYHVTNTSEFLNLMTTLLKTMMKKVIKDIYLKLMLSILKGFVFITMIYPFYQKECKLKNEISLDAICMIKTTMLYT